MLKDKMISNEELSDITGGAATPGAVMICTMAAPLYKSNPVGGQFRSQASVIDTVQPGAIVKLYEYGTKYCKVVSNGIIGWVETAFLANK